MQLAGNHTWRHAWVSCPFLEARGNLEDASTALSAHSRVRLARRGTAVSNVPTWADCRNTGKRLNERIVASSERVTVTREDECLTSNKRLFFSPTMHGDMRNGHISAHVETCHEKKKIDFELYSGKLNGTVIDAIGSKLSGSFIHALSDWYQVDYGDFKKKKWMI